MDTDEMVGAIETLCIICCEAVEGLQDHHIQNLKEPCSPLRYCHYYVCFSITLCKYYQV
jgi:hypothetical protein